VRVLVTRDGDAAARTARRLVALGHEPVLLPLVQYADLNFAMPRGRHDALAFTSARAPLAYVRGGGLEAQKTLPLFAYCVGSETMASAVEAGFVRALAGDGDAAALAGRIAREHGKPGTRVLYAAGRERSFDLAAALKAGGVAVDEIVVYGANLIDPGGPALREALAACAGGAALLYSPRTAAHLYALAEWHGMADALVALRFVALSDAVAHAMPAPLRGNIAVARAPNEAAMLAALGVAGAEGQG
jgi:uroporphyrinogen-III synthase